MKLRVLLIIQQCLFAAACMAQSSCDVVDIEHSPPITVYAQAPIYKDAKQPVDARIKDLLSRMTPEEKAGQLNQVKLTFTLTDKELSFYDGEGNLRLEPGQFKIFAGGDSKNTLNASFELR